MVVASAERDYHHLPSKPTLTTVYNIFSSPPLWPPSINGSTYCFTKSFSSRMVNTWSHKYRDRSRECIDLLQVITDHQEQLAISSWTLLLVQCFLLFIASQEYSYTLASSADWPDWVNDDRVVNWDNKNAKDEEDLNESKNKFWMCL